MFKKENYLLIATAIFFIVSVAFTQVPKEEAVLPPDAPCYECEPFAPCIAIDRGEIKQGWTECSYSGGFCTLSGYTCISGPGGS